MRDALRSQGIRAITARSRRPRSVKSLAPPYMHDGSMTTLEQIIDFYSDGGRPNPYLDSEISPRNFTVQEKRALIAFLQGFNGRVREGLR